MMCYGDKTWCPGNGCRDFEVCDRALTENVEKRAESIGALVARFAEPEKLECYVPPAKKTETDD